ncbi:MFS transporter [Cedecea sp. FDAARGOS_727]|uniref:MFS transporter n=1 Tax=Cedecea sp. FDAARGOS_727 TaxID=2545798 RepID=UPI00143EA6C3|nr:MFS transporter [Cedecea sp. FDAARGOS_727]QIX95804.1 MFS transporter [Cedecea sp. FDAARGOS_727]
MDSRRIHPGLVALSVTAFAIGVAEFIVVGILPDIAAALNIELTRAGNLVGLYALALALGSPALVLLLSGLPRKPVLMSLILLFLVGSLISALSSSYALFLTGRVLTAVAHGSFFAIGSTIASRLAPAGQAGKAIAVMFAGLTLAMVIGVPLGSLAGHTLGWRFPLFAVSALAVLSLVAIALWLPEMPMAKAAKMAKQLSALKSPAVLTMMLVTIFGFGASFAAFTFIIPLLTTVTGFSSAAASTLLVVFGAATLVGNLVGGKMTSTLGWASSLRILFVLLAIILAAMTLTLNLKIPVVVLLFLWGMIAFAVSPAVQHGMLTTATRHTPGAIDFASGLNISAFNLGIFFGENVGGLLVKMELMRFTPLAGVAMVLAALLPLAWVTARNR